MATQSGLIRVKGTLGDLTFYQSGGKFLVRQRSGSCMNRFKKQPIGSRWRANCADFAAGCKAGKILRDALGQYLYFKDNSIVTRLSRELIKVVKSDTLNEPGMRNCRDGDLQLLTGFDFNSRSTLSSRLSPTVKTRWDRVKGAVNARAETFIPAKDLRAPQGSTHFKMKVIVVDTDFESVGHSCASPPKPHCLCTSEKPFSFDLTVRLPHKCKQPLLLVISICFFVKQQSILERFQAGADDVLNIVSINNV